LASTENDVGEGGGGRQGEERLGLNGGVEWRRPTGEERCGSGQRGEPSSMRNLLTPPCAPHCGVPVEASISFPRATQRRTLRSTPWPPTPRTSRCARQSRQRGTAQALEGKMPESAPRERLMRGRRGRGRAGSKTSGAGCSSDTRTMASNPALARW
jgi:hypothetical protein